MSKAQTVDEVVLEYGIGIIEAQDQKRHDYVWKMKMWIFKYLDIFLRKELIQIEDYLRYHKYITDLADIKA